MAVGRDAAGILTAADHGDIGVLILLGADPISDFPDRALATRALEGASTVIALDLFGTASSRRADILLPAAGFAEVSGTTTNLEGRVLPVHQKVNAPGTARADWMIAAELALLLGSDLGFLTQEEVFSEFANVSRPHAGLNSAAVSDPQNAEGLLTDLSQPSPLPTGAASVLQRAETPAAALRLVVTRRMYDAATATMKSPSIAGLAAAPSAYLHPDDFAKLGVAVGTPVRVHGAAGAPAAGSITVLAQPAVEVIRGTVVVPANLRGAEVNGLLSIGSPVTDVRVDRI